MKNKVDSTQTFLLLLLLSLIALSGCSTPPLRYYSFPKVDSHVHIRTFDSKFVEQAVADNFRLLTIVTRSSEQNLIDEQAKFASFQSRQFPGTVDWATTFSMEDWGHSEWQEKTIAHLKEQFDSGAIAVKVWKDIGMTFRDRNGKFIMIDHPSFDPILDFIAEQGKTLVAHIGEPKNCWLPLDSMTVNSDRSYFERNPQYHMYLHPDYPSYDDQIAARDHMLQKHPNLRVVGAHLGSLEWDVDELAKRLDRFPNLAVDMAARICHFQVQEREKVRRFLAKYQDRLLYATDRGVRTNESPAAAAKRAHETWLEDWRYFSTDDVMTSWKVNGTFAGLKLEEPVLRKIYYENATQWLPELGSGAGF